MNFQKVVNLDRLTQEIRASAITVALDHVNSSSVDCDIFFKASLSTAEAALLTDLVTAHIASPLPTGPQSVTIFNEKRTLTGRPQVSIYEPEGASATISTHDFTDKCTWYSTAPLIAGETLTTIDNLTFASAHPFWIDLTHGRCYDEEAIVTKDPTLKPVIYIDGIAQTSGFNINYSNGSVTFNSIVTGVVTANYKYAINSFYILRPKAGEILSIKTTEVQFSQDVKITPLIFEAWVKHPVYGLVPVPGSKIVYNNEKDFMTACNGGQGLIPAWGNFGFDTHVFPFDYARPKPIKSSQNVEIRIYLKNHTPLIGSYSTGTFYVTTELENQ